MEKIVELFKHKEPEYFKEYFEEKDVTTIAVTLCLVALCYSLFVAFVPFVGHLPVFLAH